MPRRFALCLVLNAAALASFVPVAEPAPLGEDPVDGTERTSPTDRTLDELTEAYFRIDDLPERERHVRRIAEAAGGSIGQVADAVRNLTLWSDLPSEGVFAFEVGSKRAVRVTYRLPDDYDPRRASPMIICFPHKAGSPSTALRAASTALSGVIDDFVLLATDGSIGVSFDQSAATAPDFKLLLREVRKRIHIDSERVFLFGKERGGDAAWLTALANPSLVTGLISISGYPPLPYSEQFYPIIAANLSSVDVLAVWITDETAGVIDSPVTRRRTVAEHNRAIVEFTRSTPMPIAGYSAAPSDGHSPEPPRRMVRKVLNNRRPPQKLPRAQWFRYPEQGDLGWLRQTRFKGEAWEHGQLSILTTPATDRDKFVTQVLMEKMAYIGGTLGQQTTIETRRCAKVEMLFAEGSVDFGRPVSVVCNGRTRHNGVVHPSIATLLEAAYKNWEFERLIFAKLSFSIRTDAPDD